MLEVIAQDQLTQQEENPGIDKLTNQFGWLKPIAYLPEFHRVALGKIYFDSLNVDFRKPVSEQTDQNFTDKIALFERLAKGESLENVLNQDNFRNFYDLLNTAGKDLTSYMMREKAYRMVCGQTLYIGGQQLMRSMGHDRHIIWKAKEYPSSIFDGIEMSYRDCVDFLTEDLSDISDDTSSNAEQLRIKINQDLTYARLAYQSAIQRARIFQEEIDNKK